MRKIRFVINYDKFTLSEEARKEISKVLKKRLGKLRLTNTNADKRPVQKD
jgi:hypothetical protein